MSFCTGPDNTRHFTGDDIAVFNAGTNGRWHYGLVIALGLLLMGCGDDHNPSTPVTSETAAADGDGISSLPPSPEPPPPSDPAPPIQPDPPGDPAPPPPVVKTGFPYLDDANSAPSKTAAASVSMHHGFPRTHALEVPGGISAEQLSKYQFVDAHGNGFDKLKTTASFSADTMVLRHISGRAYQGFAYKHCQITAGIAFEATGPVSQGGPSSKGCAIYAGHWLYQAGSRLRAAVNASANLLQVDDAARFTVGQYVVIYDAPAGSFNNAEHAKVAARNLSSNMLTLSSRGFKSTPKAHGAGAIVAQHVRGQGPESELWAWNMTSQSPRDGAGKTFARFYADWLAANLAKYKDGQNSGLNVAGILFDADFYFEMRPNAADANNDLVRDDGMAGNGTNWLGEGIDQFYTFVEAGMPDKYILTGTHESRGFAVTNGTQMESWLDYGNGAFNAFKGDPKYLNLNSLFSIYLFNMAERKHGVPLVHNLMKTPTRLYPGKANPPPPDNRPARLGLAMTLMDDGYFGTHSLYTSDAWWDEYAVDVTAGSPTYGEAINAHSAAAVRAHSGWLGQPRGKFRRVYDDVDFAPGKSKVNNGLFESGISGWTGNKVSISRTTNALEGNGALHVSAMNPYSSLLTGAQVKSTNIPLHLDEEYTISFAAKASKQRLIRVSLGSFGERFMLGTKWRRYVMAFKQTATESRSLTFFLGQENTQVDIDSVYVFRGNTNVFRRDFDKGIVLANATPSSRTIRLGGTYQRISGSQDHDVNNGAKVTSVTLPPYDGLLLVRPEGVGR